MSHMALEASRTRAHEMVDVRKDQVTVDQLYLSQRHQTRFQIDLDEAELLDTC